MDILTTLCLSWQYTRAYPQDLVLRIFRHSTCSRTLLEKNRKMLARLSKNVAKILLSKGDIFSIKRAM